MKKLICMLISIMMLLSCSLFVLAEPVYEFGYYIDKVEYIDDNLAEATIVFTSYYGSDADMECIGFLAVYDDITKEYLNVSYKGYDEYKPFLDKQRYEVKQTVEIPDLTKLRYNFKFFVWDSTDNIKPEGFVDLGNNSYVIKKDDFTAKDTYSLIAKIDEYYPDEDNVYISVLKYDERLLFNGIDWLCVLKNSENINLLDYTGLTCNMTVYHDEEADEYILKKISVNTSKNNIICVNPKLYRGIHSRCICYFTDDNKWNNSSKIEYPFNFYINGIAMSRFSHDDGTISDTLNTYGVKYNYEDNPMARITTNNKNYKFADTDNNGYYDTLFVENSASFVVGNAIDGVEFYQENSETTYNSSTEFNGNEIYNFNPLYLGGDEASYSIHDTVGRKVLSTDIKKGDVLTVKMSSGGYYRYYDVTVSNQTITGAISEMYHDENEEVTKYVINGNTYTVNAQPMGIRMEPGVKGTFTLTPEGKIIKADLEDDFSYGIVVRTYIESNSYGCKAKVQMLTSNGKKQSFTYASELKINYQYVNTTNVNSVSSLFSGDAYMNPGTMVYYRTNEDGEIYYITSYEDFTEKYILTNATSTKYKSSRGTLNGKAILDETPIWCIGETASFININNYVFADKTVLEDDTNYNVAMLYENETKEAKLVLITNLALEQDETPEVLTSNYGVVVAVSGAGTATSNGLQFMIVDDKGDIQIYSSTTDIRIDNVPYYNNGTDVAVVTTTAEGGVAGSTGGATGGTSSGSGAIINTGTAVLYETNQNGEIKNIYTTHEAINEKDNTLGLADVNAQYSSSAIDSKVLTENTSIVCVDEEADLTAYAQYNTASLDKLTEGDTYQATVIYDVSTNEVKFAFIRNLYVEKTEQLTTNYGVLINSALEYNAFGVRTSAQIIGTDGITRIYYFTEKFFVDGKDYTGDYSNGTASTPFASGTAVVFETNEDGQIRNIYTDKYSVDESFENLGLAYVTKANYTDGKIIDYAVDKATVIIGREMSTAATTIISSDMYNKYDVSYLNDIETYNGTIIYNTETNKAIMFYVTDFRVMPDYASAPMVVSSFSTVYEDGKNRDKITGYVNGKEVSYTACYDETTYYDVRGWEMPNTMLYPGEAFWFVANENNQIVALRMIVQKYTFNTSDGYNMTNYVALRPVEMAINNTDDEFVQAVLVNVMDGMEIGDGMTYSMVGHAGIGKVNDKFDGELDLFLSTNVADTTALQDEKNIFTVSYDETTPAYFYGYDYQKPVVGTLSSVKSFEELGCIYDKLMGATASESASSCEDTVYIYNYNGKNVFNYVFDPMNNSN